MLHLRARGFAPLASKSINQADAFTFLVPIFGPALGAALFDALE